MSIDKKGENTFLQKVIELLDSARTQVVRNINHTMVSTYFEIGRMIVEEEQQGRDRAEYGRKLLRKLSETLTTQYGKGFSLRNLEQMRQFFLTYSKTQTLSAQSQLPTVPQSLSNTSEGILFNLSWSHYLKLMRITDPNERSFYEIEAHQNNWSLRELQRQCDSALYTRLALSRDKDKVLELALKGHLIETPKDAIKDPYILEFIGLPEQSEYSELELETKLIDKLEHFLLELGKGFTFVARQKRITIDEKHFRVDLVFYNRLLKSFVLIDLKIGELKHQDIGQMQMYVNYYDRYVRIEDENRTVGIILCQDKSNMLVEITLPEGNEQIFASKYHTVLPSKDELIELMTGKE
jgi:predicted nuclease of restriction endonuclease-like (RecB) superfamily